MTTAAPRLAGLVVDETSGVDHPAHLREGWVVMKGASATGTAAPGDTTKEESVTDTVATPSEVEQLQAQVTDLTAKLAAATAPKPAPAPEPTAEDLIKAAPEPVRKALEEARAVAKAAEDRAAAAEAAVTKAADDKADAEAVEKAKGWTNLAIDADKVGPALRKLAAKDADLAALLTGTLDAANAQNGSGDLFKAAGSTGGPAAGDGESAYGRLTAIAKAAVDKDPALTLPAAISKAADEHPDLYTQYLTERG